jgi:hypothetical protein
MHLIVSLYSRNPIHGARRIAVKKDDKDQGVGKDSRRGLVVDRTTSGGSETHFFAMT